MQDWGHREPRSRAAVRGKPGDSQRSLYKPMELTKLNKQKEKDNSKPTPLVYMARNVVAPFAGRWKNFREQFS